ncbi:conserved hypothetical protein [Streptomyces filamentosus NRRL 15998]|uniref:Uncharacterized protein n=1 Tax=Streptomyces filamentosus NRRL 15998 TaxID=457431 RepID=D6ATA3_STRFL|nr:conserved hypothetical protein [Streptomyces filamentosus NRRL 15998]
MVELTAAEYSEGRSGKGNRTHSAPIRPAVQRCWGSLTPIGVYRAPPPVRAVDTVRGPLGVP